MLGVAGSFTGHDRTQTQTQAAIALLSGQKAAAGMGTIPTEAEMSQRGCWFQWLQPAWVLPRAQTEQIRKRPPLRPMDRSRRGGNLHVDTPPLAGRPGWGAEKRRQIRTHLDTRVGVRRQTSRTQLTAPGRAPQGSVGATTRGVVAHGPGTGPAPPGWAEPPLPPGKGMTRAQCWQGKAPGQFKNPVPL